MCSMGQYSLLSRIFPKYLLETFSFHLLFLHVPHVHLSKLLLLYLYPGDTCRLLSHLLLNITKASKAALQVSWHTNITLFLVKIMMPFLNAYLGHEERWRWDVCLHLFPDLERGKALGQDMRLPVGVLPWHRHVFGWTSWCLIALWRLFMQ